ELYAAALAERLRSTGHTVAALTAGVAGGDVVAHIGRWGSRVRECAGQPRARRLLFHAGDVARPDAGRTMDRVLASFRPDVVHSHAVQSMSASALTRVGRRGIAHVHTL